MITIFSTRVLNSPDDRDHSGQEQRNRRSAGAPVKVILCAVWRNQTHHVAFQGLIPPEYTGSLWQRSLLQKTAYGYECPNTVRAGAGTMHRGENSCLNSRGRTTEGTRPERIYHTFNLELQCLSHSSSPLSQYDREALRLLNFFLVYRRIARGGIRSFPVADREIALPVCSSIPRYSPVGSRNDTGITVISRKSLIGCDGSKCPNSWKTVPVRASLNPPDFWSCLTNSPIWFRGSKRI